MARPIDETAKNGDTPADQLAARRPVFRFITGAGAAAAQMFECDCCGEMVPQDRIRVVIAYGIETSACAACRGDAA